MQALGTAIDPRNHFSWMHAGPGHLCVRWDALLLEHVGATWMHIAQDRREWRQRLPWFVSAVAAQYGLPLPASCVMSAQQLFVRRPVVDLDASPSPGHVQEVHVAFDENIQLACRQVEQFHRRCRLLTPLPVFVVGDSDNVVKAVRGESKVLEPVLRRLSILAADLILHLVSQGIDFRSFEHPCRKQLACWIPRKENSAADGLAGMGVRGDSSEFCNSSLLHAY